MSMISFWPLQLSVHTISSTRLSPYKWSVSPFRWSHDSKDQSHTIQTLSLTFLMISLTLFKWSVCHRSSDQSITVQMSSLTIQMVSFPIQMISYHHASDQSRTIEVISLTVQTITLTIQMTSLSQWFINISHHFWNSLFRWGSWSWLFPVVIWRFHCHLVPIYEDGEGGKNPEYKISEHNQHTSMYHIS